MHCKSIMIYAFFVILCSELSSKLQDTLEMIEEQLDQALAKTCNNFDIEYYEKVQTAYQLLGKTQVNFYSEFQILWHNSRNLDNRLTGWTIVHLVNYFAHTLN